MNGKTTLLNVLQKPEYVNPEPKIHSTTVSAHYNTFTVLSRNPNHSAQSKESSGTTHLSFIDTPGLKEIKNDQDKALNDEKVVDVVRQCLLGHIRKISCICLVFSTENLSRRY